MAPLQKKKLGELLVETGIIDEPQLRYALAHQRQWGGKLGQVLVDLELADEPKIVEALSRKLGYEVAHLDGVERSVDVDAALKLVPRDVARRSAVLPIACDTSTVTLAMSDPTNIAVTDEISFRAGRRVRIVIAGDREVARAVTRLYFPEEQADPGEHALDLHDSGSAKPLNRNYDALSDHMQERYFSSSLRELDGQAASSGTADPEAPAARPEAGAAAPAPRSGTPIATAAVSPPPGAREAALREAVDRMAAGEEPPGGLRSARLVAALTKALVRRGLVTEAELVLELLQPRR